MSEDCKRLSVFGLFLHLLDVARSMQPYTTTQAPDRSDILNVGGFSDAVFRVVASFLGDDAGRFVGEVEAIEL